MCLQLNCFINLLCTNSIVRVQLGPAILYYRLFSVQYGSVSAEIVISRPLGGLQWSSIFTFFFVQLPRTHFFPHDNPFSIFGSFWDDGGSVPLRFLEPLGWLRSLWITSLMSWKGFCVTEYCDLLIFCGFSKMFYRHTLFLCATFPEAIS